MVIVTTISIQQFSELIRNKSVSLDNSDLIFGQNYEILQKYFTDRLGTSGYVIGIQGRLNNETVKLLSKLDDLENEDAHKFVIETQVDESDMLSFSVDDISKALQILTHGLPDEMVYDKLDASASAAKHDGIEIVCIPEITSKNHIRVTSLTDTINFDADGITFVKLPL